MVKNYMDLQDCRTVADVLLMDQLCTTEEPAMEVMERAVVAK
jgi:hypothetical protein